MSNRLVSIIIVTAGKNDYIWTLLESIKKQTHPCPEVIIIDNSLSRDLKQEILNNYPGAFIYPQKENIFYCRALNVGIAQSRGDFTLCLNDDIILEPDFIKEAIQGFDIDPRIGLVSPKILRSNRKTLDSAGLLPGLAYTATERGYGAKDRGQFDKPGYVFGVNGAAAFYRRAMLEDIKEGSNYFDPVFHIFYEDLDLAWRAQRRGWKGYYLPCAVAYHIRGGTVRSRDGIDKPFARRYLNDDLHADLIKNRYLTVIKNESFWGLVAHLPFLLLYDVVIWVHILMFKPRLVKKIFRNLRYLKAAFAKRGLGHEKASEHLY
jgi:GT2 family glycosyltransferase